MNGTLSTVSVLELLGAKLVEIHGQYEQQTLLHPEHQLDIFDSYAGVLELRYALERAIITTCRGCASAWRS